MKLARQHGVEELLPHTVKGTEERLRKRMENGLRVKGTGVGQKVKGKESERTMKGRYVWTSTIFYIFLYLSVFLFLVLSFSHSLSLFWEYQRVGSRQLGAWKEYLEGNLERNLGRDIMKERSIY